MEKGRTFWKYWPCPFKICKPPDRDTQRTNSGKTVAEIIPYYYRYYNKIKIFCRGEKNEFLPDEKIPTQREWRKYLNQGQKTNPILQGFKYLEYLEEFPNLTYKDVATEFNISKARVSQMIALIKKLPRKIVDFLAQWLPNKLIGNLSPIGVVKKWVRS